MEQDSASTVDLQLQKWRRFDLAAAQDRADRAASEISVRQEESEKSRIRLIQLSKEFRQAASDEVRKQVQPLLKSFQTEVDNLVKRSSSAEAAFLDHYKILNALPDPPVILDYIAQLEDKAAENAVLRQQIADCEQQSSADKSQEAERQREAASGLESRVAEAVREGLASSIEEKEREWQEERQLMERRLLDAEEQVGILRRELGSGVGRLLNGSGGVHGSNGSNGAEDTKLSLLAEDLDRANERATSAEYKISELQQQLSSLQRQVNKSQMDDSNSRTLSHGGENGAVQRLRDELDRLKSSYQAQFNRMEDQLSRLGSQNAILLSKLDAQRDYDQVKQQLSLLKAAQYADDNGVMDADILARNRRLEAENAGLRVREMDLAGFRNGRRSSLTCLSSNGHSDHSLAFPPGGSEAASSSPSPEDPDDDLSDIDFDHLDTSNLTPEMVAKISEAKNVLLALHNRALNQHSNSSRFMNTSGVADQVNRVLEEEGITRCALAKFVLHGSYKMVYDALHDPRPWGFLNSAGRDKYRKLKLWAEDARCINAVKVLQVYCKDKRRQGGDSDGHSPGGSEDVPMDLAIPKSMMPKRRILSKVEHSWPSFTAYSGTFPRRPSVYSMAPERPEEKLAPVKRTSPQQRRQSKDTMPLSTQPPLQQVNGVFRPSLSFTASPVALGISFPDYRKNVLHQITDDMINQYDPLDTDTVTRAVRSKLNKCNVSQRLFGEVVLGMSQGAVSDLLKRPKPWNKLTRPTKEHYVRMQQFLEDEQSIPVLQAIQNREDPERVLAVAEGNDEEDREAWKKEDSPQSSPSMASMLNPLSMPAAATPSSTPTLAPSPLPGTPTPANGPVSESELSEREAFQAVKEHFAKFYQISDVSRSGMLDTVAVASRIKEELRSRNLQQKLIGELVLDVGQGTVSELLNKPKPFNMLSMKGRENYMKLLKLLQTAEDFTLLEALRTQGQQKANSKRSHSSTEPETDPSKRSKSDYAGSSHNDDLDEDDSSERGDEPDRDRDSDNHYSRFFQRDKYSDGEPEEETESNPDETEPEGQIINGVCVPQSIRGRGQPGQDTVIVQPNRMDKEAWSNGDEYISRNADRKDWA